MPYIKYFYEIDKNSTSEVGGKGASLGEMTKAGIPVPPGFVITVQTYKEFHNKELPTDLINTILNAFDKLGAERVAVRSSAVAEDSSAASWAGQLESYLNTEKKDLIQNIKKCWLSIKSDRAISYAKEQDISDDKLLVAVVVQKMVSSEVSGVMFSVNPITKDSDEVMIEASLGLGEMIVQGNVIPDNFIVDKNTLKIKQKTIELKESMMIFKEGTNEIIDIPKEKQNIQCIDDKNIEDLAKLGIKIENHYGFPCDIEWAKEGNSIYIVQSRPLTTLNIEKSKEILNISDEPILIGLGASQGIKSGPVRIILNLDDISTTKDGEILVAEKTSPDFIEAFGKVVAVVTDSGGITSHAAIVSRELGIPAVVGTNNATKNLKNGDLITVDGNSGKVYSGIQNITIEDKTNEKEVKEFKIKTSGDDITDMVNSASNAIIDTRELWPVGPVQLFSYIDFDQSYDLYIKLKKLLDEGWSFKDISKLFKYPTSLRFFMMNSGSTGLKVGEYLKLAPISIQDNITMFKWLIEILKNLTQEDPFCLEGKNIIWDKSKLDDFVNKSNWVDFNDKLELKSSINLLSVNLFTLCWSFYTDYFGADGSERHGPYKLNETKFGKDAKLLVREFFNLRPDEIWPSAKNLPFKSVILAQIYNDVPIYLNWGNSLVNSKGLTEHNNFFSLIVDGKSITDKDEIDKIIKIITNISQEQTNFVNSLELKDKIRKCAMLSYYGLKDFYLHFSDKWYPEEKIENAFKVLGDGPLNIKEESNRNIEKKKSILDPRIQWNP